MESLKIKHQYTAKHTATQLTLTSKLNAVNENSEQIKKQINYLQEENPEMYSA